MKTVTLALLPLCLVTFAGCGNDGKVTKAAAPDGSRASSGFEMDADGWTITGDAQTSSVKPDYNGHGGNPDGLISAVDDVAGGVWYFRAPAKYLGDAANMYGRFLDFDLKTNAIRGEFQNGTDTGSLDNVRFGAAQ